MYMLITYDIESTKRRNKIATLLEGYGNRVNYSVFELDIKKHEIDNLIFQIKKLSGKRDSVRVYRFSKETVAQSFELLDRSAPFKKESGYVD